MYSRLAAANWKRSLRARALSATPIVTNQVPYSLTTRTYLVNGVIPFCQEQGIVVTAYSPVEVGRVRAAVGPDIKLITPGIRPAGV